MCDMIGDLLKGAFDLGGLEEKAKEAAKIKFVNRDLTIKHR